MCTHDTSKLYANKCQPLLQLAGRMYCISSHPPTMSDHVYGGPRSGAAACVRMHNCRYHPSLSCWSVSECITCSAADRLDSDRSIKHPEQFYQPHAEATCVRHDALQQIRRAASQIVAQIASLSQQEHSPSHKHPDGPRCGSNSAKPEWIATSLLLPSWRFFSGPYHLSPAGSAFLACTVHNALARSKTCASSMQCEHVEYSVEYSTEYSSMYSSRAHNQRETALEARSRAGRPWPLKPSREPSELRGYAAETVPARRRAPPRYAPGPKALRMTPATTASYRCGSWSRCETCAEPSNSTCSTSLPAARHLSHTRWMSAGTVTESAAE